MQKSNKKSDDTFIVRIMNDQNGTWQGSITWIDEQKTMHFRSAMEMLLMIDEVRKVNRTSESME